MGVLQGQTDAEHGELAALEQAFTVFTEQTAQLRESYLHLKGETRRINLELEEANRALERKIGELDAANNLQHSILESIPTAVVVTDLDGIVNTINAAAERLWGISRREALGKGFRQVMGEHGDMLAAVLAGGRRRQASHREVGDGAVRIISSTAARVENSQAEPVGAVQIDHDITHVWKLESRVNHRDKLADLGEMAAGLVHEIRKPLNGIKGFASLLERKMETTGPHQRYVESIMGAADRLNGMLGRLLDFARPDALRPVTCDLSAEAEQVIAFIRAEDPGTAVRLTVAIEDRARFALADPNKIKQVLLNLVKNAVEALDSGKGEVCVRASYQADDERPVRVEVADNGTGIAKQYLAKVKEPFFTNKPGGTGLGLSIVNRILQLHGTELHIDSRPGRGTTMGFTLKAGAIGETT